MASSDVLDIIDKRIRNIRKKMTQITQIEEKIKQGREINNEQKALLSRKQTVADTIQELKHMTELLKGHKLQQPGYLPEVLATIKKRMKKIRQNIKIGQEKHNQQDVSNREACLDELAYLVTRLSVSEEEKVEVPDENLSGSEEEKVEVPDEISLIIEDLLSLIYFANMFDSKSVDESNWLRVRDNRIKEREYCLSHVDHAMDKLNDDDLDMISRIGGGLISRPYASSSSHKKYLKKCIQHAKHWIAKSPNPIRGDSTITYEGLRKKLAGIMASSYFTEPPAEVAAAADGDDDDFW